MSVLVLPLVLHYLARLGAARCCSRWCSRGCTGSWYIFGAIRSGPLVFPLVFPVLPLVLKCTLCYAVR